MMLNPPAGEIDYLAVGHITCDLTPAGPILGGTVSYAALTAQALGVKTGLVTALGENVPTDALQGLPIAGVACPECTTFENIQTSAGRVQFIHQLAPTLKPDMVPAAWLGTPVVHLGPVVHEVDDEFFDLFPDALIGVTPQGWLRQWDAKGRVTPRQWSRAEELLQKADVVIVSIGDLARQSKRVRDLIAFCNILVVTQGPAGARVFHKGRSVQVRPPRMTEVDPVGAGDIFAAAFFCHFFRWGDPFEAGNFATRLAAYSVTRPGIAGIPTAEEIKTLAVDYQMA